MILNIIIKERHMHQLLGLNSDFLVTGHTLDFTCEIQDGPVGFILK